MVRACARPVRARQPRRWRSSRENRTRYLAGTAVVSWAFLQMGVFPNVTPAAAQCQLVKELEDFASPAALSSKGSHKAEPGLLDALARVLLLSQL
jgi:hypothetical protein